VDQTITPPNILSLTPLFIVITILIFAHLIYWKRRQRERVSYSQKDTIYLFIVLILLVLELIISYPILVAMFGVDYRLVITILPILAIAFFAIITSILAWGKKQKDLS
jgi:O-antigen/teichoic acid export membrane protein